MKKKILGGFEICISAPLEVAKQLLFSLNQISLLNMEKLSYGNQKLSCSNYWYSSSLAKLL